MHTEKKSRHEPEPQITMPSELRIRQRLGQISIGEEMTPKITYLEKASLSPLGLVRALDFELRELATDTKMDIEQLTIRYLPRIIELLVDDVPGREQALSLWEEMVNEQRDKAERIERSKKRKIPRKKKKNSMKGSSSLSQSAKAHSLERREWDR